MDALLEGIIKILAKACGLPESEPVEKNDSKNDRAK